MTAIAPWFESGYADRVEAKYRRCGLCGHLEQMHSASKRATTCQAPRCPCPLQRADIEQLPPVYDLLRETAAALARLVDAPDCDTAHAAIADARSLLARLEGTDHEG